MELRSYGHLHYIQAIKGSSVIKLLNVNTRGRPTLTFKNVKEIYKAGDAENHVSATIWPKNEFESSFPSMVDKRTISPGTSEFNCSDGGGGKNNNFDSFTFDNITLKQFKESCKARKRKCSEYAGTSEGSSENFFSSKQDPANLKTEADEFDLKEPLISWKSKISKNKKGKKQCIRNNMSTTSQSAIVIVKAEPVDATVEVNEIDYSNYQSKICVTSDSSISCHNQVDSCGVVNDKAHVTTSECVLVTDLSISFEKEKSCVVHEASYEYREQAEPESDLSMSFEKKQSCLVNEASYEYKEHADPGSDFSMSFGKEQPCVVNKSSCDSMNDSVPEAVSDARVSCWEIVNVDNPEAISYQYPGFPVENYENELYIVHPLLDDVSPEPISISNYHDTDICHNSQCLSFIHTLPWPNSSNSQIQMHDLDVDNRLQCLEIIDGDGAHPFADDAKDDLASDLEASTINAAGDCSPSKTLDSCLSPDSCSVSLDSDSPWAEEKQLFLSACADAPRNCPASISPYGAADELRTSPESGDYSHSELLSCPARLLSTRKAISPTSQEKLCKAMNSIELDDEKHSECCGKLLFGSQPDDKVSRTDGCNNFGRIKVTINGKQVVRKHKHDTKGSNPRANLKGPHLSSAVSSLNTGCTSSQKLSQSAIAFSQRQMHDIESLATKLTVELSSMKDLVKEMLQSGAYPSTSLKHNMAKVMMAVKNATKAEETANRWLSIMARDCNRFCKIMKLSETGSAAPRTVFHKERKKITFADEAGGKLCHVKFFKDDMASPLEFIDVEE